jgi:hypothetical protein
MNITLTQYELSLLTQILNAPGGPATIEDLRTTRDALKILTAGVVAMPEKPAMASNPDGSEPTAEQKDAFVAAAKAYKDKVMAQAEETAEVNLPRKVLDYIKTRMARFSGFYNDEKSREKALALVDKLSA